MDKKHHVSHKFTDFEKYPLLLSSLADFWSLIEPLLKAAAPKTVCEIGIGQGKFTEVLLDYCRRNGCRYCGIDPAVDEAFIKKLQSADVEFFKSPSLSVLTGLSAKDVYFIDGDHNYHTVINELRMALQRENHWPLVILHDVGWPWGRRDHYCSPESIPQAFRHPYSNSLGAVPGRTELGPNGFCGETSAYKYASAEHEGGPRNGVLTAVEDFLREEKRAEWKLLLVPSIFGLGILCAPEKSAPDVAVEFNRLDTTLAPLRPLLDLLEQNRIALFLTYLRHVSELNAIHDQYAKLAWAYEGLDKHSKALTRAYEGLDQHVKSLATHSDKLLANYRELETYSQSVQKICDDLQRKAQV
jgi:Methyltransferase domain